MHREGFREYSEVFCGVQGANVQLRARVAELGSELQAAREEAAALRPLLAAELAQEGGNAEALAAAAVGRERAVQDARNRKVLELLHAKARLCPVIKRKAASARPPSGLLRWEVKWHEKGLCMFVRLCRLLLMEACER
jgi:hypothetical protein